MRIDRDALESHTSIVRLPVRRRASARRQALLGRPLADVGRAEAPLLYLVLYSSCDDRVEVMTMTAPAEHGPDLPDDNVTPEVTTEVLVRRQGVQPITSLEQLDALAHPELWDSDEEYADFLADLYASRRANVG